MDNRIGSNMYPNLIFYFIVINLSVLRHNYDVKVKFFAWQTQFILIFFTVFIQEAKSCV